MMMVGSGEPAIIIPARDAGRRSCRPGAKRVVRSLYKMPDWNGFLTSTEFVAQVASIVVAILTAILGELAAGVFSGRT